MSSTNQPSTPGSTSNPALSGKSFNRAIAAMPASEPMTVAGAVNRSLLLVAITVAAAWVSGSTVLERPELVTPVILVGAIGGFIVALITIFKANFAHITAPLYAILEGAFIGAISIMFNQAYPGIVLQAVGATFAVFLVMLILYRARIIKVTERFRMIVIGATMGILVFYLVTFVIGLFGVDTSALFVSGPLAIGISAVIVLIAALNLALDFDFIEAGANAHAPARMEWYAAFGLLVTLVWLYLEILRLLAATRR